MKYEYEEYGEFRCGKLFSKLLEVDELVIVREYQKENKYTMRSYGEKGNLGLYTSTSKNPTPVDEEGCFLIGNIISPGHGFLLNQQILVKMCFGETEIEFNACQPKRQKTSIHYLERK